MRGERAAVWVGLTLLTLLMIASFVDMPWNTAAVITPNEAVAAFLFDRYVFSIVVMALILAVAMVGGVFLARREAPP